MVTEIRLFFEGIPALRAGFHAFLSEVIEAARRRRVRFQLVAGGAQAVRDFMKALRQHPAAFNVLLVDSEGPDDGRLVERLRERADWQPPAGIQPAADQVLWMVQLMESWFLADRAALQRFYGFGFHEPSLPSNPQVEHVPKDDALRSLRESTRNTRAGTYRKSAHAPRILVLLDPAQVRTVAPHCRRMFECLQATIVT